MEFPKLSTQGGVLGNIKSKLGFGGQNDYDDYDDYEEYDEYDEYGEDFDDQRYTPSVTAADLGRYDDAVSVRPVGAGRSGRTTSAELVSYKDAKASSRYTDTSRSSEITPRVPPMQKQSGAGFISPYEAINQQQDYHSDGLNSLFMPSMEVTPGFGSAPTYASYDSASTSNASFGLSRKIDVMRPMRYDDVEQISESLKAGSAVVVALRGARDDIAKRILDFSFGAASMCDARVDKLADDVFVIATGSALLPDEIARLRNQGIL